MFYNHLFHLFRHNAIRFSFKIIIHKHNITSNINLFFDFMEDINTQFALIFWIDYKSVWIIIFFSKPISQIGCHRTFIILYILWYFKIAERSGSWIFCMYESWSNLVYKESISIDFSPTIITFECSNAVS